MSVTRQRPPGVGPPSEHDTTPWVPGRPLWQQFLIGAVGVLLVVGAILLVVRFWAIPALQSRGADNGIAGEATLAALQTQQATSSQALAGPAQADLDVFLGLFERMIERKQPTTALVGFPLDETGSQSP